MPLKAVVLVELTALKDHHGVQTCNNAKDGAALRVLAGLDADIVDARVLCGTVVRAPSTTPIRPAHLASTVWNAGALVVKALEAFGTFAAVTARPRTALEPLARVPFTYAPDAIHAARTLGLTIAEKLADRTATAHTFAIGTAVEVGK